MSIEEYIKKVQLSSVNEKTSSELIDLEARNKLKEKIIQSIKDRISENRDINVLDTKNTRYTLKNIFWKWIEEEAEVKYSHLMLSMQEKNEIFNLLLQNMFGYGVIEPFLKDSSVTEIMINGRRKIFIEKNGIISRALDKKGLPIEFTSEEELKNIIDKIVAPINRKVDESDPIVDARLPDGSRVNIVLNPISLDGSILTIRKFPENPYTMEQLVEFGALPENVMKLLDKMVKAKYNIIVSGGTGSGKTTFLNALSMFLPPECRVITVEDSAELKFTQVDNLIRLETRLANLEGKGEIAMRDLVRSALRMRPDRIIVGEVRGGEALDMLQAMNTGHDGSLSTGHANSSSDMLMRLETMVLMSGMQLPIASIRQQISSAVDFIIHLSKLRDGTRRVVEVLEIEKIEGIEIQVNPIFSFKEYGTETVNGRIRLKGRLEATGNKIKRTQKFLSAGIDDFEDCIGGDLSC
ncbi:MAG: CpaF family protein [Aminipila sp.]